MLKKSPFEPPVTVEIKLLDGDKLSFAMRRPMSFAFPSDALTLDSLTVGFRTLDSIEFANNQTMQLVIHPIWWENKEGDPVVILSKFETNKSNKFKDYMADNCAPYREHLIKDSKC